MDWVIVARPAFTIARGRRIKVEALVHGRGAPRRYEVLLGRYGQTWQTILPLGSAVVSRPEPGIDWLQILSNPVDLPPDTYDVALAMADLARPDQPPAILRVELGAVTVV